MSRLDALRSLAAALLLLVASVPASAGPRYTAQGEPDGPPVEWIAESRRGLLAGSGALIYAADLQDSPQLEAHAQLAGEVTAAVALGDRLLFVDGGRRLRLLEHGAVSTLPLSPAARGDLIPAVLGDVVVLAEDGVGLRVLQVLSSHHHGHFELAPLATLPLAEDFTALATSGRTLYAGTASRRIVEVDLATPTNPALVAVSEVRGEIRALAAGPGHLIRLGCGFLTVFERAGTRWAPVSRVMNVSGRALRKQGRMIYIGGRDGVQAWRDRSAGGQTHEVTVGNDFFSPLSVVLEAGDSVEWTNAAIGGFHNVESCTPDINGCDGQTSNEAFTSGPVAGPPWTYTHTFQEPGRNDYVCISHLPFMTGVVYVGGIRVPLDDIRPLFPPRGRTPALRD